MSELTLEQGTALEAITSFLRDPEKQFFLLGGYAGTGKTYCIQHLVPLVRGRLISQPRRTRQQKFSVTL
jgi:hypothetical protein